MNQPHKTKTVDLLLDTAQQLILQEGYRAVSVDRIIETAAVSKGTFFYHFKSKELLAIRLFDRFLTKRGEAMQENMQRLQQDIKDPLERMYIFIDITSKLFQSESPAPGCLIGSYSYQLTDEIPVLKDRAEKSFNNWVAFLAPHFTAIEQQYSKQDPSVTAEQLAVFLFTVTQGAVITTRVCNNKQGILLEQLQQFKAYLALLFRH